MFVTLQSEYYVATDNYDDLKKKQINCKRADFTDVVKASVKWQSVINLRLS